MQWAEALRDPEAPAGVRLLLALAAPASWIFRAVVAARNGLYDSGAFHGRRLPCRVVSIGNLAAGGTGKTPTVLDALERLTAEGRRVGLLSRGYGGRLERSVTVLHPGETTDPADAGDEPAMIRRRLPSVPIGVGRDRYRVGSALLSSHPLDVIVMDDGFQYRTLHRDLDVVLLDAARPFGNGYLLPRGILREPPECLQRAGVIVETRWAGDAGHDTMARYTAGGARRVLRWRMKPLGVRDIPSGRDVPLATAANRPVHLLSGIASPGAFRETARETGAMIAGESIYPDHYPFRASDLDAAAGAARAAGSKTILMTEKDAVKCRGPYPHGVDLWALSVGVDWMGGEATWRDLLLGNLGPR